MSATSASLRKASRTAQLAGRLFITERTVEAHVKQIFLKLGLDLNPDSYRRVLAVLACLPESARERSSDVRTAAW